MATVRLQRIPPGQSWPNRYPAGCGTFTAAQAAATAKIPISTIAFGAEHGTVQLDQANHPYPYP